MRTWHAAALVATLTFGSGTGCSALFVDAPPPVHARSMYFDCTSSRVAPGIDVALASIFALSAVAALSDPHETNQQLVGTVAFAGGLTASAVYGMRLTGECRQAKSELAARFHRALGPEWNPAVPPGSDPWQSAGPPPPLGPPAPASPPSTPPSGAPP
jgi:hypothetical protein